MRLINNQLESSIVCVCVCVLNITICVKMTFFKSYHPSLSLLMNLNCFVFSLIEQMCCLLNNSKKTPLKSVLKFIFTAYERKVNESITTFFMFMW